jgi:hypothetical protein
MQWGYQNRIIRKADALAAAEEMARDPLFKRILLFLNKKEKDGNG